MKLKYASICDIGLRSKENQDRVLCLSDDYGGLFVVADGMGGLSNGSFASQTIIEELTRWWYHYSEQTCSVDEEKKGAESLKEALRRANETIFFSAPEGRQCGSTVVALLLEGSRYSILSCGDSRCYLMEKQLLFPRLQCLTRDDIWENVAGNIRGLSPEMIRHHRNRGKLVRAVGTGRTFSCSEQQGILKNPSAFLLCSDGVYKRVTESETARAVKKAFSGSGELLKAGCEELKQQVYRRGASDNLSVILIRSEG